MQQAYYTSETRFNIALAGRRSGKSDIGRRRKVRKGLAFTKAHDGLTVLCAPTREHAKRLHWRKLKDLIPRKYIRMRNGKTPEISESELTIKIDHNGYTFAIVGLDKPERAEGDTIDDCLMDEVADMKPTAWGLSIRPSLSTEGREGSADFIGKPRGKGFYFELWQRAQKLHDWSRFHWKSSAVLSPDEISSARDALSAKEFAQEYEADWVSFEGLAYYPFDEDVHGRLALDYDPTAPLDFCFDFNVSPGIALVVQPQSVGRMGYEVPLIFGNDIDAYLDEVYIEDNSNTRKITKELIKRWGSHEGDVRLFGDFSGGSRKTSATEGSDWEQIEALMRPVFGDRLERCVKPPTSEVDRINALNARLLSHSDRSYTLIDPDRCPNLMTDFQTVQRLHDGQLDKTAKMKMFTHMTDAAGDRARFLHPTTQHLTTNEALSL
tara:strand:- start:60131 stop:61441 length:1311 start_codon:yes stop_codon:yes gene_type:complete